MNIFLHEFIGLEIKELKKSPDIRKELVKKAFKKRALQYHPDKGGLRCEYDRLCHAKEVFLDNYLTNIYILEPCEMLQDIELIKKNVIAIAFSYFDKSIHQNPNLEEDKIAKAIIIGNAQNNKTLQDIKNTKSTIRTKETLLKRLIYNNGNKTTSPFHMMYKGQIKNLKNDLRVAEATRCLIQEAIALLKMYEYVFIEEAYAGFNYNSGYTSLGGEFG